MPGKASKRPAPTPPPARQTSSRAPAPVAASKPAGRPAVPTSGRRWAGRLAIMVVIPMAVLMVAEGLLRLFGVGNPTSFFVRQASGDRYTSNGKYVWQYYLSLDPSRPFLFSMAAKKPADVCRIFILGESAAMGTPDPAFSFGRILEVMLQQRYPAKRFEVINAAMRGINSHIILPIARECAGHEPDVFLLYAGNNEVIGLHGPDPDSSPLSQNLTLLRALQPLKATRLGQWVRSLAAGDGGASQSDGQDVEYYHQHRLAADDWRREAVRRNFRANLEDVCGLARKAGARVVLSTVAVNLKDCPPLGSLHRSNLTEPARRQWEEAYARGTRAEAEGRREEAVKAYQAAVAIDDHYAELHYRLARCALAAGEAAEARRQFALARDWDALAFRTDTPLNELLRKTAAEHATAGVTLVDAERAFADSDLSDQGIPGEKLFHEHVHHTFDGDYLLARTVYPAVVAALGEKLGTAPPTAGELPSRQACADVLAYTVWDDLNVAAAMRDLTARAPFTDQLDHAQRHAELELSIKRRQGGWQDADLQHALEIYRQAIQRRPDDWKMRFNLATFYQELGRHPAAAEQFQYVANAFPDVEPFRLTLGIALAHSGRREAAVHEFEEALRLDRKDPRARKLLAWVRTLREDGRALKPRAAEASGGYEAAK